MFYLPTTINEHTTLELTFCEIVIVINSNILCILIIFIHEIQYGFWMLDEIPVFHTLKKGFLWNRCLSDFSPLRDVLQACLDLIVWILIVIDLDLV